jgi:midasin (ATPase involved in ribosome maturation)
VFDSGIGSAVLVIRRGDDGVSKYSILQPLSKNVGRYLSKINLKD